MKILEEVEAEAELCLVESRLHLTLLLLGFELQEMLLLPLAALECNWR